MTTTTIFDLIKSWMIDDSLIFENHVFFVIKKKFFLEKNQVTTTFVNFENHVFFVLLKKLFWTKSSVHHKNC